MHFVYHFKSEIIIESCGLDSCGPPGPFCWGSPLEMLLHPLRLPPGCHFLDPAGVRSAEVWRTPKSRTHELQLTCLRSEVFRSAGSTSGSLGQEVCPPPWPGGLALTGTNWQRIFWALIRSTCCSLICFPSLVPGMHEPVLQRHHMHPEGRRRVRPRAVLWRLQGKTFHAGLTHTSSFHFWIFFFTIWMHLHTFDNWKKIYNCIFKPFFLSDGGFSLLNSHTRPETFWNPVYPLW